MKLVSDDRRLFNAGSWRGAALAATILLGSLLIAALALNEIRFNTPSFDGAMNLQVPRSLVTTGRYSTTYDAVGEFTLQTGPPLLLPIALAFRLLGVSSWTAQLPNVIYLVGMCTLLMLYASRFGGIFGALVVLLLILSTRDLFDLGLRVYGEIPALFFFIVALLLFRAWEDRPQRGERTVFLIGVCLGLAVLTKTVMLIAFPAVACTIVAGPIVGLRRPRLREALAFGIGPVGVLCIFEAFKLMHLGTKAYLAWWRMMLPAIGQQAGVADPAPASFLANIGVRFSTLSLALGVPRVGFTLFLVSPYLLILILAMAGKLGSCQGRGSLLLLTSMSGGYLAWWLIFTPLNRIWLRRIINGVLLHELLAAVALTAAMMILRGRAIEGSRIEGGRALRAGAGALGVALLFGVGTVARYNLGALEIKRAPSHERVAAERLARRIRSLPKESVIYGRGWWQAPVVSFFAGRQFKDLDWMPSGLYEVDLDHHYFVADQALTGLARDELDSILARMDYEAVESVFDHTLVRVRRVYPYSPFAKGEEESDLRKLVNVAEDDYPHIRGFHDPSGGGRWARRSAGILLRRGREECLKLSLFFPDMNDYRGKRVLLSVEVDDMPVRRAVIATGGNWEAVLPVPRNGPTVPSAGEVEVSIDNWWRPGVGNFSQTGFLMSEVGFVDCQSPQRWHGIEKRSAEPLVVLDYGPRSAIVGRGFNVQPDGRSAMWFRVKGGGQAMAVFFGKDKLRGFWDAEKGLVTVALPEDALAKAGTREIRLCELFRDVCSAPIYFPVFPPQGGN